MLKFQAPAGFEAQVEAFLQDLTPDVTDKFDDLLSSFWDSLYTKKEDGTLSPLFAEEIIFDPQGEARQTTEKYKIMLHELKESLEKENSTVMLSLEDTSVICVNYMEFNGKRYLQFLTPEMAVDIRQKYDQMLNAIGAEATKELSPWQKICNAFSSFFLRRPGRAAAQKEAYRELYSNLQKNYNLTEQALDEMESHRFRIRADQRQKGYRDQLEEDYWRRYEEKYRADEQAKQIEVDKRNAELDKIKEQRRKDLEEELKQQQQQNEPLPNQNEQPQPAQNDQDSLKNEQPQPKPNVPDEVKNEAPKVSSIPKAPPIPREHKEKIQKQLQKEKEEQRRLELERENQAAEKLREEWVTKLKAAGQEANDLKQELEKQIRLKDEFIENLNTIKNDREDKLDRINILTESIDHDQKALNLTNSLVNSVKSAIATKKSELETAKETLDKEKYDRDRLEQESANAQTRLDELSKDWDKVMAKGALMNQDPKVYLEYVYKQENAQREEQFKETHKSLIENMENTRKALDLDKQNLATEKSKTSLFKRTPEDVKKRINELEKSIKDKSAEFSKQEKEYKTVRNAFEAEEKKIAKEYLDPTKEKLQETLDHVLIPGREEYQKEATTLQNQMTQLTSIRDAFKQQDKLYQEKLSSYSHLEQETNKFLTDKNTELQKLETEISTTTKKMKDETELRNTLQEDVAKSKETIRLAEKELPNFDPKIKNARTAHEEKCAAYNKLHTEYTKLKVINFKPRKLI